MNTPPKNSHIIGIHGLIHTGKDTIANYLVKHYKYIKAGFSDPLKYACAEMFMIDTKDLFDADRKEITNRFWGVSPRKMLQFVGTELVRDHMHKLTGGESSHHWIRCMEKRIIDMQFDRIVINDLRFQNEADWVISRGGTLILVKRDTSNLDVKIEGIPGHISEGGIDTTAYYERTFMIENNGTMEGLYDQIEKFLQWRSSIILATQP